MCIHGVSVCLCLSHFSINFLLLSVSPDPQTPITISVCDNPTAWLQRDVTDHQLGAVDDLAPANCLLQTRACTESNGEPSASSSTRLPVENETVREEAVRTVNEVVIEDVCDKEEEGESNDWLNWYWNDDFSCHWLDSG